MTFDYASPAELFMTKRKGGSRQPLVYRRFASAAEAIRFAIEDFPAVQMLGVWLQVDDERFDSDDKSLDALIAPTWRPGAGRGSSQVGLNSVLLAAGYQSAGDAGILV